MVHLGAILLRARKRPASGFIDSLRVYVCAGTGGAGLRRYGGKGGRGGHVYVVGHKDSTLKKVRAANVEQRYTATHGHNSKVSSMLGSPGTDLEIDVPLGITVKNDRGVVLGEVLEPGDKVLVARGGDGGDAESHFHGQKGHTHSVRLDLKLIADVGLVGFPNAGKSTLLSAVSRAAPKIANYPFTTIQPQVGTMVYSDLRQIKMADLPGLIEGAHVNVGMGHHFLKHVERTKLLLFVVDLHGFRLSQKHQPRTAFETMLLLNKELELYKEELLSKPALLALNKTDVEGSDSRLEETLDLINNLPDSLQTVEKSLHPNHLVKFDEILPISAKTKDNTEELRDKIRERLDHYADLALATEQSSGVPALKGVHRQLEEHYPGQQLV